MISSVHNPKIKEILKLRKAGGRKKTGSILIEGRHEISLAIDSKIEITALFYSENFKSDSRFKINVKEELIKKVSLKVFKEISYRENPDGYLALAKPAQLKLGTIKLSPKPLVLILEAMEKPGNLGAILRTADAAGVCVVIINEPKTDIYNPNVIRSSLGAVFTNNIVIETPVNTLKWLKLNKISSFAATPDAKNNYSGKNFNKSCAIVIGEEHRGLGEFWLKNADHKIKIPMLGKIDSLNASVSAAIMLYEALRQRLD